MSAYGADRGDEILTEASAPGTGFLSDVVQPGSRRPQPPPTPGAGLPAPHDAAAAPLWRSAQAAAPAFKLGSGSEARHRSAVHVDDLPAGLGARRHLPGRTRLSGPVNLGMPGDATNAEFSDALARRSGATDACRAKLALQRAPRRLPTTFSAHFASSRALLDAGFTFDHPDLESALMPALA